MPFETFDWVLKVKVTRLLKVKITHEGQMIKWSLNELVWAITSTFMHGFQNNLAQVLSSL